MPSQQYLISMQPLVHMCRWWRGLVFALPYHLNLQLFCTIKIPARVTQDIWPTLPLLIQGDVFKTSLNDVIAELEHSDHICKIKLNCYTSSQIKKLWTAMQVLGACTSEGLSYQPVLPNSFLGLSLLCMHSECLLSCNFVFLSMYSTIPESHSGHELKLHWSSEVEMRDPKLVGENGMEWGKGKGCEGDDREVSKKAWNWVLTLGWFGVQTSSECHNPLAPNFELDHQSGSSLGMNLGLDHSQVWPGSGSNQGSEPNLTTPSCLVSLWYDLFFLQLSLDSLTGL